MLSFVILIAVPGVKTRELVNLENLPLQIHRFTKFTNPPALTPPDRYPTGDLRFHQ